MTLIAPRERSDRPQAGEKLHLLDVRTPSEHAEIHVPGVYLMPLDQLDATRLANVNGFAKNQPVYIFCRSGNRAKQAAEKLEKGGYEQCSVVEGGTTAWAEAGLPVTRGTSKVMSIERQVRIAAGTLVATGVVLARFVNPAFMWLSGFIGAGLVITGITDWCGMGILLAKMRGTNAVAVAPVNSLHAIRHDRHSCSYARSSIRISRKYGVAAHVVHGQRLPMPVATPE